MKKLILFIFILTAAISIYIFFPYSPLSKDVVVDKLVVQKSERKLAAYSNGVIVKTYSIALGDQPVGAKEKEGDEKTPEGNYIINSKAGLGSSGFYKNLGISYPSKKDINNAKKHGYSTGGDIKIHGLKNGLGFIGRFQSLRDWTNGCIAVTNEEMDDLFKHVKIGTPIQIIP